VRLFGSRRPEKQGTPVAEIHPRSLGQFVRAVAVLALPYEQQFAWLHSLGLGIPGLADELFEELRDGRLLASQFREMNWISAEAEKQTVFLYDFLAERDMSEFEGFWDMQGLRTSPAWDEVRKLAFKLLLEIT